LDDAKEILRRFQSKNNKNINILTVLDNMYSFILVFLARFDLHGLRLTVGYIESSSYLRFVTFSISANTVSK
jgi:hypothetical protein